MIYVMKKRLAQVLAVALVATSLGPTGLTASAATLMAEEADPKSDEGVMGQKDAATDAEEESGILTLAEENRADTSGICGKDGAGSMIWSLVDGVLTISGEGEMEDYGTDSGGGMEIAPWRITADDITEVKIEEGVTSIGEFAFYQCGFSKIEIPESLDSIGRGAFMECGSLENVELPEGLTSIGTEAFYDCGNLRGITIPGGVTTIGVWTFGECVSLESLELSEGLISIEDSAFCGCSNLVSVKIPNSVETIGISAFQGCEKEIGRAHV